MSGADAVTVVTYNIKAGQYHRNGLEAVARVTEALKPDLLALQEVDRAAARTGGVDQARWLGKRLGLQAVFGRSLTLPGGGDYGNALLSRWPITRHQVQGLPLPPRWEATEARWPPEPRSVLLATVETPRGALHVGVTHFGLQAVERRVQAEALLDIVGRWAAEGPVVVAGDFNAAPDAAEIAALRGRWVDVAEVAGLEGEERRTFPSGPLGARTADGWAEAIDYVFVRGLRAVDFRVVYDESLASDHQPVVAQVAWSSSHD
jgi:endonuclease/exonuclease/phosphatase family metal-dependent hydrolase